MLVQLQNYRKRDRNEYKHSEKVWMNAGGSKAYHHRSNQLHHKGSSKEKRKSDLRRPLNLRSGEVTLSIAVGESIPECTEGESTGYESQAGAPCVTGCVDLCEAFAARVRKQYPNP